MVTSSYHKNFRIGRTYTFSVWFFQDKFMFKTLILSDPGLFWVPGPGEGGGVGWKVPAAHNSKTIHGIEVKFGRVVENHKQINLL